MQAFFGGTGERFGHVLTTAHLGVEALDALGFGEHHTVVILEGAVVWGKGMRYVLGEGSPMCLAGACSDGIARGIASATQRCCAAWMRGALGMVLVDRSGPGIALGRQWL